jgi:hypothetical protein
MRSLSDLLAGPDLVLPAGDGGTQMDESVATLPFIETFAPDFSIDANVQSPDTMAYSPRVDDNPPPRVEHNPVKVIDGHPIIMATNVGEKLNLGITPTKLDYVKDAIGSVQTAIATPIQSAGRAVGGAIAGDKGASAGGAASVPVVLGLVALGVGAAIYAARKGGSSDFKFK